MSDDMNEKPEGPDEERRDADWKDRLSAIEYHVTRESGTEPPFTGRYWDHEAEGVYVCVCCEAVLFDSSAKFASGCGWPSYSVTREDSPVGERPDHSHGMTRTEIYCKRCDAHLGHVFQDGPPPTGLRYCVNSASLRFRSAEGELDD